MSDFFVFGTERTFNEVAYLYGLFCQKTEEVVNDLSQPGQYPDSILTGEQLLHILETLIATPIDEVADSLAHDYAEIIISKLQCEPNTLHL